MSGFASYRFPIGLALATAAQLFIGQNGICFPLHIDWLTERACGCGRAAHSPTHLIHSLDNNGNKTVVACSSNTVKKGQVKCIKEMYTNAQQT